MYWSNYHSHCIFCDGRSSMEDFVKFAIAKNVRKYGFSSHAPLPFLTKWTMLEDDFADYQTEFFRLKRKYENVIELYFGLEVDYIDNCSNVHNTFFEDKIFDYLIGSIHYLDKLSENNYWTIDGDFKEFDKGLNILYGGDIRLAVNRFYEISSLMIQNGGFDIVGHFDKISLHISHYKNFNPNDKWYENLVGEVLQLIKEKGMILEINTKSMTEKGITYPHRQFYSLIKQLDIPIMVNSDCHYPTNVIDGFEATYKDLKATGFKTLQQIVKGKWQGVEFNEKGLFEQ
ncbi:MAG: histidinol-phosphatase [Paludibacter sp.]|nr:histidinol-phosphatase [Paludibacter sp.]